DPDRQRPDRVPSAAGGGSAAHAASTAAHEPQCGDEVVQRRRTLGLAGGGERRAAAAPNRRRGKTQRRVAAWRRARGSARSVSQEGRFPQEDRSISNGQKAGAPADLEAVWCVEFGAAV